MTQSQLDQTGMRVATTDDVDELRRLAIDNGLFRPDEMGGFDEMLSGYLDGTLADHEWIVLDDASLGVLGAAYYAPEPVADRLWNLYFLAAAPGRHREGAGGRLVDHVESDLRRRGHGVARVLIVETSSGDGYEHARAFYGKHGFVEEARIREFYGPGDHKVVFWKSLS
ncbi:MAG: GNAT family N-acetyltransferase [Ilumatobacteraceae bacterium]